MKPRLFAVFIGRVCVSPAPAKSDVFASIAMGAVADAGVFSGDAAVELHQMRSLRGVRRGIERMAHRPVARPVN